MVKKKNLVWQNCSELKLGDHVSAWLKEVSLKNALIFLEGEMGAGKSTFVREILQVLAPESRSQGSPTFPLVQTYETKAGIPFYHIDLYRLKSDDELSDSGIEEQINTHDTITCVEWASLFPDAFAHWFDENVPKFKSVYIVSIANSPDGFRDYTIETF
jgi:tRNA threonylcarbamoyl adenosine modification protein YjeE